MNNFLSSELRLVKSREPMGLVVQDQPSIFQYWRDDVAPFEEPIIFLAEKYVGLGGTPSKHTWEAAGYDLLSWFQWCQLKQADWRSATESDRKEFGDDYLVADRDEKTINRKLTIVRRFYEFARAEGWYHRDMGSSTEQREVENRPIDDDPLAHTRPTGRRVKEKDLLLKKVGRKDLIRPMQVKQLRKLLQHLGPTVQDTQDKRQVRDRLICDLAWSSGTRLGDVTKLTTLQFLNIIVEPHQQLMEFPLIVEGKMKVTRKVAAPGWLILAIQAYINSERAKSEREGKKRGVKPNTALFLGHANSKSAGKKITGSAIQKMFALACMKCGITEQIEVVDVETGAKLLKTVPVHSFHDLRHNCAVLTYHAEKAQGNKEPWKVVQIKLGHKSLSVTINTYLAHVEIFGEKEGVIDIRRLIGLR
ncbi:Tyrosine recombinase XerC [Curvibacter sp. AEP1-3]|uniref:tyrosine-type recombinase/integrase n=1 Tax=Curvibacter sp. AEP1-3 TaxID=1844971 RepID=UPI000B3C5732|nr:tyrosine-type recombinase/integrase [Curvibacter sp. AEP1-3]ARV20578.1 Tyrosine recombinase XerC [Curvibacter sp. AEP1-3]